jgi:hypothetical protein
MFPADAGPYRRTALLAMVGLADTPRLAVFVAERCGILSTSPASRNNSHPTGGAHRRASAPI